MAARLVAVVGRKNAGKTTLAVALCQALARQGRRVMTLKHGHHPALVDREGTDTWRHFNEGGAERTLIAAPDIRVLFERTADDYDPVGLTRQYMRGADIVIAEGYSRTTLPRVEIWRSIVATPPIVADAPDSSLWRCVVSDVALDVACPLVLLSEPDWIQHVAELAWQGALEVDA
jgi:molybdopterin-guanine dinucleotide biosynthesis protein B